MGGSIGDWQVGERVEWVGSGWEGGWRSMLHTHRGGPLSEAAGPKLAPAKPAPHVRGVVEAAHDAAARHVGPLWEIDHRRAARGEAEERQALRVLRACVRACACACPCVCVCVCLPPRVVARAQRTPRQAQQERSPGVARNRRKAPKRGGAGAKASAAAHLRPEPQAVAHERRRDGRVRDDHHRAPRALLRVAGRRRRRAGDHLGARRRLCEHAAPGGGGAGPELAQVLRIVRQRLAADLCVCLLWWGKLVNIYVNIYVTTIYKICISVLSICVCCGELGDLCFGG